MNILCAHNRWYDNYGEEIMTYSRCMVREFIKAGHMVVETGKQRLSTAEYKKFDFFIDVDSGRDAEGNYDWHLMDPVPIPSAAFLIDSHGKPDLHRHIGHYADHVFFAVWNRRDLFADHKSAHWTPNFTDLAFLEGSGDVDIDYDFGFIGSKKGLARAEPLRKIAQNNGWSCNVKEVAKKNGHRWPATAKEMLRCKVLFNHGQKHDDPNLRVMESMYCGRALITPNDPESGMGWLFEPWIDYIPYEAHTYKGLEERMTWAMNRPDACEQIANNAYRKVNANHLTRHRIKKVLEVIL